MKIILLKDIKNLGKKNDIKDVREGYARNFLLSKDMALQTTPANLAKRQSQIAQEERELGEIKKTAEKLSGEKIEFKVKTGTKGEVFGSVTKEDIKKELLKKGYKVLQVNLDKSLKTTGEHKVRIIFKFGVRNFVVINIVSVL